MRWPYRNQTRVSVLGKRGAGGDPLHWRNEHTHVSMRTVCARARARCTRRRWRSSWTEASADYHKKSFMSAHARREKIELWAIQWPRTDRPLCFCYKGIHKKCQTQHRRTRRACRTAFWSIGSGRLVNSLIWEKWRGFLQLCIKLSLSVEEDQCTLQCKNLVQPPLYMSN